MSKDEQELTTADRFRSLAGVLLFFVLLALFTPVIILLLIVSFGKLTNYCVEKIGPMIGKPVLTVSGVELNVTIHNPRYGEPVVYIINHSTTLDLLILLALGLPGVRFVAKHELQYNPFLFILGHLTGQVFIQRQNSDKAVANLRMAYKRIQDNELSLMLAPEGSRKHEGKIGPFKKGPFRTAFDLGYPIVPIYIGGADELNDATIWVRKGEVKVTIHPPIDIQEWSLEKLEDHIADVRKLYLMWAGVDEPNISLNP